MLLQEYALHTEIGFEIFPKIITIKPSGILLFTASGRGSGYTRLLLSTYYTVCVCMCVQNCMWMTFIEWTDPFIIYSSTCSFWNNSTNYLESRPIYAHVHTSVRQRPCVSVAMLHMSFTVSYATCIQQTRAHNVCVSDYHRAHIKSIISFNNKLLWQSI